MDKKKKRIITWVIIVIVAAVVIILVAVTVHMHRKSNNGYLTVAELADYNADVTLQEAYSLDFSIYYGDEDTEEDEEDEASDAFLLVFDDEEETFFVAVGDEIYYRGRYELNGNYLKLSYYENGVVAGESDLILDGDCLLMVTGGYPGYIPDEDLFEASVSRKEQATEMTITYSFQKDGTYTAVEVTKNDEEYDMEGTYSRDGNFIFRTLSGNEMIPFYIYNHYLFVSYYIVTDLEDYY